MKHLWTSLLRLPNRFVAGWLRAVLQLGVQGQSCEWTLSHPQTGRVDFMAASAMLYDIKSAPSEKPSQRDEHVAAHRRDGYPCFNFTMMDRPEVSSSRCLPRTVPFTSAQAVPSGSSTSASPVHGRTRELQRGYRCKHLRGFTSATDLSPSLCRKETLVGWYSPRSMVESFHLPLWSRQ